MTEYISWMGVMAVAVFLWRIAPKVKKIHFRRKPDGEYEGWIDLSSDPTGDQQDKLIN